MKRILCLMLVVTIFTSTLFGVKREVRAEAVLGLTYLTGEAVASIIISCCVLAGIVEECEDTDFFDSIDEMFQADIANDTTVAVDTLLANYSDVMDEVIATGQLYDVEASTAWDIIENAGNFEAGCDALADAMKKAWDLGVDLDGNTCNWKTKDGLKNYKTAVYDPTSNSTIVSPSLMNDLINDIDVRANLYNEMANGVTLQYDSSSSDCLNFDYSSQFIDIDSAMYNGITFREIIDNAISNDRSYLLRKNDNDSISLAVGDSLIFDLYDGKSSDYYNIYCGWNCETYLWDGSSCSYAKPQEMYYSKCTLMYYDGLTFSDTYEGAFAIPESWGIENMNAPMGIAGTTSNILTDAFDVTSLDDTFDEGMTGTVPRTDTIEQVSQMVLVPPVDDVITGVHGVLKKNGAVSIPHDEVADVIVPGITVEIPKTVVPSLSDEAINVYENTDTLPDTDEDIPTTSTPTVDTGWEWLDDILNAILSILNSIWLAITGVVEGIVDGILDGLNSALQWLLDGLSDLLVFLFVPSDGYLDGTIEKFMKRFEFFDNIIAVGTDIGNFFTSEEPEPPTLVVDFSASDSDINYGGKTTIDFSWYAKYKSDFDKVISAFLWAVFAWNTFKNISAIVNGAGAIGNAVSYVNKSDKKGSEDE